MRPWSIAFLVYGEANSGRDALQEEKYKALANAFLSGGSIVTSVIYNDETQETLYHYLLQFDAVLVWVNPIEQGKDRRQLDMLLHKIAEQGCFVSAHPSVILKIGTKDILFKTKEMDWSAGSELYRDFEDFVGRFREGIGVNGVRVLKQFRGNGGNGVFKVTTSQTGGQVSVVHAKSNRQEINYSWSEFFEAFRPYFLNGGLLIEQEWNYHHANGMVRCYLSGNKVAGFGYQEINALYEITTPGGIIHLTPSQRFYFTENCGLFADLKEIMENKWVPELQKNQSITNDMLPVIWDADFFINKINSTTAIGKYTLCEINTSSVSPFPPSAIKYIVDEVNARIRHLKDKS